MLAGIVEKRLRIPATVVEGLVAAHSDNVSHIAPFKGDTSHCDIPCLKETTTRPRKRDG